MIAAFAKSQAGADDREECEKQMPKHEVANEVEHAAILHSSRSLSLLVSQGLIVPCSSERYVPVPTSAISALGRSRPAADAWRGTNGAVIARELTDKFGSQEVPVTHLR